MAICVPSARVLVLELLARGPLGALDLTDRVFDRAGGSGAGGLDAVGVFDERGLSPLCADACRFGTGVLEPLLVRGEVRHGLRLELLDFLPATDRRVVPAVQVRQHRIEDDGLQGEHRQQERKRLKKDQRGVRDDGHAAGSGGLARYHSKGGRATR